MSLIVDLTQTCDFCPSQWEGVLDDGRVIYVRYRHGWLSVGVGKTMDEALDDSISGKKDKQMGADMDGVLSTSDMLKAVGEFGFFVGALF